MAGYIVVVRDAPRRHRGGVAVLHWPAPYFAVEAIQQFGTNFVSFQMETGARQWYIVGYYLAPDNTLTIESVVAALKDRPRGAELMAEVYNW